MLKRIDYLPFLESCWQEHLKEKPEDAPTVISTFAGCGGSSLGYSMAGFRELLAVEWEQNAVDTFKMNFSDVPVYHGDIAKLFVDQCLDLAGIEPGQLDVFDGSPPCQGFSTAGKRQIDDPRNSLFREYVRLLRGLKPKVFVMENVSGMIKGLMKLVFVECLKELKASGYRVSARLLNAMYFGVPQSRQRMIFIGVREDLGIDPSHPVAWSVPVTVRQAFANVPYGIGCARVSPALARVIPKIKQYQDGGHVTGKTFFSTKRLSWVKPGRTISKDMVGTRSAMVHPDEDRPITIPEAMRISSFPDQYDFGQNFKCAMARIGNSVPPLMMRSIALYIRQELLKL